MAPQSAAAEIIPDVDDNAGPEQGAVNENGLTPTEQAEFDAMRTGEPPPAADEPAGDDGDDAAGDDSAGDDLAAADGGDDVHAGDPVAREGTDKEPPAVADRKPPKTVNYSKYQRELQKANKVAQEAQEAARVERENRIKLSARVDLINEALQQQTRQQEQQPEPDAAPEDPFQEADIDPNVDFAAAISQINRRQRFQLENQQNLAQSYTETNADRQMKDTFERDFRAYAQTDASIVPAYQFLKDSRLTEICITKFDKDPNDPEQVFTPQEVQDMVNTFNQEEKWVVSEAIKAKKSPAAAIMKLAKARGFKAGPAAAPAAPPAAAPRAPAAPAAPAARRAPVAPAAPTAQEQLAQLRQNQEDARSLSDGGGAPPGGLTAEMILKLNDAEFAEMIDSMSQSQLDALMGRAQL